MNRRPAGPQEDPLVVLLLPRRLEAFELREHAEDLLEAPGVIAVDPAPLSYGAVGRLPRPLTAGLAAAQAGRLLRALPGRPRAVTIFHPFQLPLAEALLDRAADTELWYWHSGRHEGDAGARARARLGDLHDRAEQRSDLTFAASHAPGGEQPARAVNRPLFERMEALGVESGRLGSERLPPPVREA